jgi:hypothetical protein
MRDNAGGHAGFRRERLDATNPARRRPSDRLSGFNDLGEELAVPRKLRMDTIMTTAVPFQTPN